MGECTRLFHFQTLVFRLPEIQASLKNDEAKVAFASARQLWFQSFKSRFVGKLEAAFVALVADEKGNDLWLGEGGKDRSKVQETAALTPLFEAYRELRILHQISYADYKLHDDYRLFPACLDASWRRSLC
jgi:hypothetical protein